MVSNYYQILYLIRLLYLRGVLYSIFLYRLNFNNTHHSRSVIILTIEEPRIFSNNIRYFDNHVAHRKLRMRLDSPILRQYQFRIFTMSSHQYYDSPRKVKPVLFSIKFSFPIFYTSPILISSLSSHVSATHRFLFRCPNINHSILSRE
jgi:hypothetical protein